MKKYYPIIRRRIRGGGKNKNDEKERKYYEIILAKIYPYLSEDR